MTSTSNVIIQNSIPLDEDASYLDQYYLGIEEEPSMEEQEDVNLYDLYDSRTPYPRLKTPADKKADKSQLEIPSLDQEELLTKLWNVVKSSSPAQLEVDAFSTTRVSNGSTGALSSKYGGDKHSTSTFVPQGKPMKK